MKEWLDFFNKVGMELQDLVLTRKQFKLAQVNEQISEIERKLESIKDTNPIIEFNNNMKKKLEKLDREVQKKKVKKYIRDSSDFKNNRIYLWQNSNAEASVSTEPNKGKTVDNSSSVNQQGRQTGER